MVLIVSSVSLPDAEFRAQPRAGPSPLTQACHVCPSCFFSVLSLYFGNNHNYAHKHENKSTWTSPAVAKGVGFGPGVALTFVVAVVLTSCVAQRDTDPL